MIRRANSSWARGRWNSAIEDMRAAGTTEPSASSTVAYFLLRVGRRTDAKEIVDLAVASGAAAENEALWAEVVDCTGRSMIEPDIDSAVRHEGRDCVVVSRLPERDCKAAVEAFDGMRAVVESFIGRVPDGEDVHERVPVFLFHSPDKFERYRTEVLKSNHDAVWGLHSATLWQVVVQWRLPRASLRTVRHEAVHNHVARRFASTPTWLNEGLACYLECAEPENGEVRFNAEPRERLSRLRPFVPDDVEWLPFAELLALDADTFYEDTRVSYGQSLALVHYLLSGGEEQRALWDSLVDALAGGASPDEVAALLADAELDERVPAHVRSLGLR